MNNRRPIVLLATLAGIAVTGLVLAGVFDDQKGWNHPGQAVSNIAWIVMLLAVLGLVLVGGTLAAQSIRRRHSN